MSWSKRKRGRLQRTHMKTKMITERLGENHDGAEDADGEAVGDRRIRRRRSTIAACPATGSASRRRTARRRRTLVVIMPAYSARKNRANRIELYSV